MHKSNYKTKQREMILNHIAKYQEAHFTADDSFTVNWKILLRKENFENIIWKKECLLASNMWKILPNVLSIFI